MSDPQTTQPDQKPEQVVQYALHSTVRAPAHRLHRAAAPAHVRKKHFIGGDQLRLLPARPLIITDAVLQKNLDEIKQKAAARILEVRTLDGRVVDLATLQPGPSAPAPLLPHPKLDSLADDKPSGMYIPPYVGDDTAMPTVLPHGEKPTLLRNAARDLADAPSPVAPAASPSVALGDDELDAALDAAQREAEAPQAPPPAVMKKVSSPGQAGGHRGGGDQRRRR